MLDLGCGTVDSSRRLAPTQTITQESLGMLARSLDSQTHDSSQVSASSTRAVVSREDSVRSENGVQNQPASRTDLSPSQPAGGEKPNDLLQRLYDLWPSQLTPSYRPHAAGNPAATADLNLRYIRELYPPSRRGLRRKTKAAGMVVETVLHLDRKSHYNLNLSGWARH